jgi:hypothetical protein
VAVLGFVCPWHHTHVEPVICRDENPAIKVNLASLLESLVFYSFFLEEMANRHLISCIYQGKSRMVQATDNRPQSNQ